jgi:hypothetical protein
MRVESYRVRPEISDLRTGSAQGARRGPAAGGCSGRSTGPTGDQSSSFRAETKASWGTSTRPMFFIFFFPSFCFSSSLRLRVMSPP